MFVGRKSEQEAFVKWLEDGDRRAMVVVGNSGMGKSALLAKFAELCEARGRTYVQVFKLNRNENAAAFFERVLQETHRRLRRKMLPTGPRDRELVKGLLKAVPKVGKLLSLLVADEKRPGWRRFLDYAAGVDKAIGPDGRLVLLVDPDGKMEAGQADEWLTVAGDLPRSVRVVIAQRPDDVIAGDSDTRRRFEFIPKKGRLGELDRGAVEEWYEAEIKDGRLRDCGGKWSAAARRNLMDAVWERFGGYPIAHEAAVRLLASEDAVEEPAKVAETWPREIEELMEMLYESLARQGEERLRAGLMLAVFGVATPREAWAKACGKSVEWLLGALADAKFGLFFEVNGEGEYAPFHALFGERLEQSLSEIPGRTQEYAEAAWGVLEPALDEEKMARERPREFELMAGPIVARRFEGAERLVEVVNRVFGVKLRLGMLDAAEMDMRYLLVRCAGDRVQMTAILGNLGMIMQMRGDLDDAELLHRKLLNINKHLGRLDGVAATLGRLGHIAELRDDNEEAEKLYAEALRIGKQLADTDLMAIAYGGLGLIAAKRGNFEKAESLHSEALRQAKLGGQSEGMSTALQNLGRVAAARGNFSKSYRLSREGLQIDEQLGRTHGIGGSYGNLGIVACKDGRLDEAHRLFLLSRATCEVLGNPEDLVASYVNLGIVELQRGNLDEAEQLQRQSLAIRKQNRMRGGGAAQYGNLGLIAQARGKLDEAKQLLQRSLKIDRKLGHLEGMANTYANLGAVAKEEGIMDKAVEHWTESIGLYEQMGMGHMVEEVQAWLDELEDEG